MRNIKLKSLFEFNKQLEDVKQSEEEIYFVK